MATLLCPDGGFRNPIAHGLQQFHAYRLDYRDQGARDSGGPWAVDVPDDLVQYFVGQGGFSIMDKTPREPPNQAVPVGMIRLRKIDGGDASVGFDGLAYLQDRDGTVMVPMAAMGALVESHGYEIVDDDAAKSPDHPAEADAPAEDHEADEEDEDDSEEDENENGDNGDPPKRRPGRPRRVPRF